MWFYNSNYCNSCKQSGSESYKNCCSEEQQNDFVCCGKTEGKSCCYYPSSWQSENNSEEQNNIYERPDCRCNLKESCFREYSQENSCQNGLGYTNNGGCCKQKQCFKPKKRCCFCDFFNCICGGR